MCRVGDKLRIHAAAVSLGDRGQQPLVKPGLYVFVRGANRLRALHPLIGFAMQIAIRLGFGKQCHQFAVWLAIDRRVCLDPLPHGIEDGRDGRRE
ncbi:Uncharacterised protein [Mycobacteroides abscessus subsp. abscessus]|nr:Uncharacterised protein [Mycobacteroides abscessus subsp. abscessus]